MSNFLVEIQNAVRDRLLAPDHFGALSMPPSISTESVGSIDSEIEKGLTGNGCHIVIATPGYSAVGERIEDGLDITVAVSIHERASINRGPSGTGLDYLSTAIQVIAALAGWSPGMGYTAIRLRQGGTTTGDNAEDIQHEVEFGLGAQVARVPVE